MKIFYAALLFLLIPGPAFAQENVSVDKILSGDEIALKDGRVLRLKGVKAQGAAAAFLQNLAAGKTLTLREAETDRYGRVAAVTALEGSPQTLEESLLREGLAFVYPALGGENDDAWIGIERAARNDKRGAWADLADTPATDAAKLCGMYGFMAGSVTKAERIANKAYLSFGDQDGRGLKVTLAAKFLRPLKKRGFDVLESQGRFVRLRGWVDCNPSPVLTLTGWPQIEFEK